MLRKLSMRAHSRHELAEALRKRQLPAEVIDEVLDRFTEVELIDDASFAAAWSESRHRYRRASRRMIAQELRTKGVDDDHVREALTLISDEDEWQAALAVAQKKARSLHSLDPLVARRRLAAALARRGYSSGIVQRVCQQVLDGEDEGDHTLG